MRVACHAHMAGGSNAHVHKFAMSCCEPGRRSAYSEDLRWKMVWQSEGLGLPNRIVAKNLCVDSSTVSRTLAVFRATGSVSKRPYPKHRGARKLTKSSYYFTKSWHHTK